MPVSNNHIKGVIIGVIGVSTLLCIILYKRKLKRKKIGVENDNKLNTNFNHHEDPKIKTFNTVAIGRSDITRSISSRNSILKEPKNVNLSDDFIDGMNCGRLALKSLDAVISSLQEATLKIDNYEKDHVLQDTREDSHLLLNDLRRLIEDAYQIRNKYKQNLITTSSSYGGSDGSDSSSDDSFVSANDYYHDDVMIDEYIEASDQKQRYLFKAALMELEKGNISYRSKRTSLVGCPNDTEYLAKLHCIRLACNHLFENEDTVKELESIGDSVGTSLLLALGYDPEGFQRAYKNMITFLRSPGAHLILKEELCDSSIETISFYDIFFDFIVFDALESLQCPPSSLVSIINNRWLSEGFKKTTLSSSVWTILLAKRKFLKHKAGFKAHFYDIINEVGVPLAWSFLGPEPRANLVASVLRDTMLALGTFMFSDEPRFTCESDLAGDIMSRFRTVKDTFCQELDDLVTESASLSA